MKDKFRLISAFLFCVILTTVIGSMFSTQFVVSGLRDLGIEIPLLMRVSMTIGDLAIIRTLGLVVMACFLLGFIGAKIAHHFISGSRLSWYTVAGALSIVTGLLLMGQVFQLMPIAGARTTFGMFTQGLAGGIGGFIFARLTKPKDEV
jgi:hypothetical protein